MSISMYLCIHRATTFRPEIPFTVSAGAAFVLRVFLFRFSFWASHIKDAELSVCTFIGSSLAQMQTRSIWHVLFLRLVCCRTNWKRLKHSDCSTNKRSFPVSLESNNWTSIIAQRKSGPGPHCARLFNPAFHHFTQKPSEQRNLRNETQVWTDNLNTAQWGCSVLFKLVCRSETMPTLENRRRMQGYSRGICEKNQAYLCLWFTPYKINLFCQGQHEWFISSIKELLIVL